MDGMVELIGRTIDELLSRASGPFHLRLVLQPVMATILAIRAGLADARRGQPPFFWTLLTQPDERRNLFRSGWKDVGKVFVLALILDAVYQLIVLRAFHPLQALLVAAVLAIVPYVVVRGPVTRFARAQGTGVREQG